MFEKLYNTLEPTIHGGSLTLIGIKGHKKFHISIPTPLLSATTNTKSITTSEKVFIDKYNNKYKITLQSSLKHVYYEIVPLEINSLKHAKLLKKNLLVSHTSKAKQNDLNYSLTLNEINNGYEKRLFWSDQLIQKGFFDISITVNVSSIETLLKDTFKNLNSEVWFHHIHDNNLNNEILLFLKVCNLKDFYLKELLNNSTLNRSKKLKILSEIATNQIKNINFQELEGQGSFNWLIKKVLNIDIILFLQSEKLLEKNLKEHLKEMYILRHKIIHGTETEKIKKKTANLYNILTNKISTYIIKKVNSLNQELLVD